MGNNRASGSSTTKASSSRFITHTRSFTSGPDSVRRRLPKPRAERQQPMNLEKRRSRIWTDRAPRWSNDKLTAAPKAQTLAVAQDKSRKQQSSDNHQEPPARDQARVQECLL